MQLETTRERTGDQSYTALSTLVSLASLLTWSDRAPQHKISAEAESRARRAGLLTGFARQ